MIAFLERNSFIIAVQPLTNAVQVLNDNLEAIKGGSGFGAGTDAAATLEGRTWSELEAAAELIGVGLLSESSTCHVVSDSTIKCYK